MVMSDGRKKMELKENYQNTIVKLATPIFIKKNGRLIPIIEIIEYCQYGVSIEDMADKAGISPSTFLSLLQELSNITTVQQIYDVLGAVPSKVVCFDIVYGKYNGKQVYYWHGKCPYTKLPEGWVLSTKRTLTIAKRLVSRTVKNRGSDPKICISDKEESIHSALEDMYSSRLRTIYLNATPSKNKTNRYRENKTYQIFYEDGSLVVKKGTISPRIVLKYKDENGYKKLTSVILHLFNKKKARVVCIMTKYKIAPLKNFCKRFVYETRKDHHVYHFMGSCRSNGWAEALGKKIKRRNNWFDNNIRRLSSAKQLFDIRMKNEIVRVMAKSSKKSIKLWKRILKYPYPVK